MSIYKRFLKDTFIYGLAIVLPRLINFLLVRLHTDNLPNEGFSENTEFYVVAAFFNVLFTYGLETSFFRFFSQHKDKNKVLSTALISILVSTSCFGVLLLGLSTTISDLLRINPDFYTLLVSITLIDTLVVIPFAYLRVTGKPVKFAIIKLINVLIIVLLNILLLSKNYGSESLRQLIEVEQPVSYIFIANLVASLTVLALVLPYFFKVKLVFDSEVYKQMLKYGWPIMVAGIAFVLNENLDKWLLPVFKGKAINGAYAACYKLAVFMTLFIQAFRMGAEPFFFNYAKEKHAKTTYAMIMKYFVIVGVFGLMLITIYIDLIRPFLIQKESYLIALDIVPLILLANLCLGIYHNLSVWYKLTNQTKYGMYISIMGAAMTIVLNLVFIPKYGFMTCAYTTVFAYGLMMILSYVMGKKHYPVPYDVRRISIYFGYGIITSFSTYYIFDKQIIIGSVFLLGYLIIIWVLEKQDFKRILKSKVSST